MVTEALVARPAVAMVSGPRCIHHWVIEAPNGRCSIGACKRCGLQREFRNSTETAWDPVGPALMLAELIE